MGQTTAHQQLQQLR